MRNASVLLAATVAAAPILAGDGVRLRYHDPSARYSVRVTHDIEVQRHEPVLAGRTFSFDVTLLAEPGGRTVSATIDRAAGTYSAHDMKSRLGTRHLTGKSFTLTIAEDGRELRPGAAAPEIDLGPVVAPGFSPADLLVDILPALPDEPLRVGDRWFAERPVRTLEGWTWATGTMTSTHRVTDIERAGQQTLVTVDTEAKAWLGLEKDDRADAGELSRKLQWTFDAGTGRLLALSLEQLTKVVSLVPQGEIRVHQTSRVVLEPLR